MWQVKLTRGNLVHEFQYPTEQAAEDYAKAHRSIGYYEVEVKQI